jgi:bifunctional non-homologous end joining protein LigD
MSRVVKAAGLVFIGGQTANDRTPNVKAQTRQVRKQRLRDTFENTAVLIYVTGVVGAGAWVFERAGLNDFEGMVAKRLDSTYQAGRCRDWLKVKNANYSRPAALGWGRGSGS